MLKILKLAAKMEVKALHMCGHGSAINLLLLYCFSANVLQTEVP